MAEGLPGDDLTAYRDQRLKWSNCESGSQCTKILVPLDYANPSAGAITLAMRKIKASKGPKLGTLFINPGGPGGSGQDLVANFDRAGLERYDVIGWDPRGVGESTPVVCFDSEATDAYLNLDASPDDPAERDALIRGTYEFGKSCWEHSGKLLDHISTIETVRDLDLLRELVGDPKLNFLGYSYGTQIGATYAEIFPANVGRLVLDAAVNITDSDEVIQAMGFDLALGNFAKWCAAEQECPLGRDEATVLGSITGLWDRLDQKPLPVGDRRLTQSLAVLGVAAALYGGKDAWPALASYVKYGIDGNGEPLLYLADQLNDRSEDGQYASLYYSFPAIGCLDSDEDLGVIDADRVWQEDQRKAPIFGKYFGPQYVCALWPTRPARQLDIKGSGAAPILVIGGTGDNATPYQQAVDMAAKLDSGVLLTYQGEGHGSYGGKSTCIDKLVRRYLVKGKVPADGTKCS